MQEYKVLKNTYIDSVTLMSASNRIKSDRNYNELIMLMGTPMNVDMITNVGFHITEPDVISPSDLIIAVKHQETESQVDDIFGLLTQQSRPTTTSKASLKRIEEVDTTFNLAVISVAGQYAAYEALNALNKGLHVMMFSDNVTIDDEVYLKEYAIANNLLMMGPDCGTAIINGKGLCFANEVRRGSISLVAASGTGLQEVTVLIDQFGGGINQAIGVGGRDLSEAVGGRMMIASLLALKDNPTTEVVVVISKPPATSVEEAILNNLRSMQQQVVVCFLDSNKSGSEDNLHFVSTLSEAAVKAVQLQGITLSSPSQISNGDLEWIRREREKLSSKSGYLRGLYCGGTLTAESLSLLRPMLSPLFSNVAKKTYEKMENPLQSEGNTLVDLGDDVFTNGRPHPMIEPTIRLDRILIEAKDPSTSVILLDFELGYGSHEDPVGITLSTIKQAQQIAANEGRHISFVAYVLGTDQDWQSKSYSVSRLQELGVFVARTNMHAALVCAALLEKNDELN